MEDCEMEERRVEMALLNQKVETLTAKLDKLEEQLDTLLGEWQRANGILNFIKWFSGIGAFLAFLWSFFHLPK